MTHLRMLPCRRFAAGAQVHWTWTLVRSFKSPRDQGSPGDRPSLPTVFCSVCCPSHSPLCLLMVSATSSCTWPIMTTSSLCLWQLSVQHWHVRPMLTGCFSVLNEMELAQLVSILFWGQGMEQGLVFGLACGLTALVLGSQSAVS